MIIGSVPQTQDVLHVVDTRRLRDNPLRGAQGAAGEDRAVRSLVGELEPLAEGGEDHRVVADDVAAAQGMDAHLAAAGARR